MLERSWLNQSVTAARTSRATRWHPIGSLERRHAVHRNVPKPDTLRIARTFSVLYPPELRAQAMGKSQL